MMMCMNGCVIIVLNASISSLYALVVLIRGYYLDCHILADIYTDLLTLLHNQKRQGILQHFGCQVLRILDTEYMDTGAPD